MFDPYEVCPESRHSLTHRWVAGMMHVHEEDILTVAAVRDVECERCEKIIGPKDVR